MSVEENPRLLGKSIFESAYGLFLVETDEELINRFSWLFIIITIVSTLSQFWNPNSYGKFSTSKPGRTVGARYGWMIQEVSCWVIPLTLLLQSPCGQINNFTNLILVSLFVIHHFQRTMVYPWRITKMAKPIPVSHITAAFVFSTLNGFFQTHHLMNVERVEYSIFVIPGVILCITGMVINIYHDWLLVSLKVNLYSKDKMEYQIPRGGLFEYVSAANYSGEIIEWWGFAIASGKFPQLIFAILSTVFLSIRAWQHHQNYKKLFGKSLTTKTKSIVPFIF